jgi:hypothetical protein
MVYLLVGVHFDLKDRIIAFDEAEGAHELGYHLTQADC